MLLGGFLVAGMICAYVFWRGLKLPKTDMEIFFEDQEQAEALAKWSRRNVIDFPSASQPHPSADGPTKDGASTPEYLCGVRVLRS